MKIIGKQQMVCGVLWSKSKKHLQCQKFLKKNLSLLIRKKFLLLMTIMHICYLVTCHVTCECSCALLVLQAVASWRFCLLQVDNFGTVNLVEACRKAGVTRFILVSSILVNGAAMGQLLNPAYIVLNLFGLVLVAKLQAEKHIRSSGINYTIIRPGGLTEQPPTGNIVMEPEVK